MGRVTCERGNCEWSAWAGHLHIKRVLGRSCATCGEWQLRGLPPDRKASGPDARDLDLVWNGTREDGE